MPDLLDPDSPPAATAILSNDGRYRYLLTRWWAPGPAALFVMLNPSTADGTTKDSTIRRCAGFARSWGCGSLRVVNLYALRATNPAVLWTVADPVGPDNDHHVREQTHAATRAGTPLIAAWGVNARPDRVAALLELLPDVANLSALGVTKNGSPRHPRHPLYLSCGTSPAPWPTAR